MVNRQFIPHARCRPPTQRAWGPEAQGTRPKTVELLRDRHFDGEPAGPYFGRHRRKGRPAGEIMVVQRLAFLASAACLALASCAGGDPAPSAQAPAQRPFLNVQMRAVEFPPTAANGGVTSGVQMDLLPPGGASAEAGLREGDIVILAGGRQVASAEALVETVQANGAGKPMIWTFLRDGQRRDVPVTPRLRGAAVDQILADHVVARIAEEESLGDSFAATGQRVSEFSHYVRALQLLYYSPARSDTESRSASLLTRMILVRPPELRVPAEAQRHRARAAFIDALYHAPWLPELWHSAGLAAEKAGGVEDARRYLRRALMLSPDGPNSEAIRQRLSTLRR